MTVKSPEDMARAWMDALNSGSLEALLALYEPSATLIPPNTGEGRRSSMSKRRAAPIGVGGILAVSLGVLFALGGLVDPAAGQGLPPGVHHETVAEYPSADPGIEKVVIKKFTLDPGAKEENFTADLDNLCTGAQGETTVVAKDGKKLVRKAGQVWIERKGESFSFYNNGKVPWVDIFVTRIPKKM
jgi:hypothetical protein